MMRKTLVISLGGSLIVPDGIDTVFLKKFKKIIAEFSKKNRVIIICGGGNTARRYNLALRKILPKISSRDLDFMGIGVTRANALLVKNIFGNRAQDCILQNPTKILRTQKHIIIGCGWKPGCSTDKDAVLAARTYGIKMVVNLSNIAYIYNKDPKKYQNARPFSRLTWKELRKIVGDTWRPGAHVPFDPVAAKLAEKQNIELIVMNGKNLKNFKNYLEGKKYIGTRVANFF